MEGIEVKPLILRKGRKGELISEIWNDEYSSHCIVLLPHSSLKHSGNNLKSGDIIIPLQFIKKCQKRNTMEK